MNNALTSGVQAALQTVVRPLRWRMDLGPIGTASASSPQAIRLADGAQYVIKCPSFAYEAHAYLCANEWICGLLALQAGLPALVPAVVFHPRCLAVGWPYVPANRWVDVVGSPRVLAGLEESEIVGLAVFDALVRNVDRHHGNIVVLRGFTPSHPFTLLAYDFDRALLAPGSTPETVNAYPEWDDPSLWLPVAGLRRRVLRSPLLFQTVTQVQDSLSDSVLETIVESTPDGWLTDSGRKLVLEFLRDRLNRLRDLVDARIKSLSDQM